MGLVTKNIALSRGCAMVKMQPELTAMPSYNDILLQNQVSSALGQAQQAEWDADQYRQASERLEGQVAALRAEIEGKDAHISRLERENDKLTAENLARRAQTRVLLNAAKAANLPVTHGEMPEHLGVFRQIYNQEAQARGLPPANWDR